MFDSHHRNATSIATKATELAFAAPQVVAHRLARMAMSGPALSARDCKEFQLMGAEKVAAFSESWTAMALQFIQVNQRLAATLLRSFYTPWTLNTSLSPLALQWQGAALGILSKGIAPVHRKATANARRLARTPLR